MTTSGTIAATTFTTRQVIEAAARRCKVASELLTPEHVSIATDNLFLLLSDLANMGAPLWCIEQNILPLYEGVGAVPTPAGTVDVLNANLRTLTEQTGTNTDGAAQRVVAFASETIVTSVGIKWDAAAVPLEFARSDDGATWDVIQTEAASGSAAGEWDWYDLDSAVAASYFRVRATSGSLTFDTIYLGNSPSEVPMGRLNRDQYAALSNRSFQSSQPVDFWLDRQADVPIMRVNPVPNEAASLKQITIWRHRHVMDVGTMAQTLEIPQRWYEAVVSGLAAKVVWEFAEADIARAPTLAAMAQQSLYTAQTEERDNSPIQWVPDFSVYTA